MFEIFTEAARRTVFMGRYEASRFGSASIEVEHLLLGFLRADVLLATRVFGSRNKLEEVRHRIESELPRAKATPTSVDLPFSIQSKSVLTQAAEEANRLGREYVAAEHLLLGILLQRTSIAARVLLESGIDPSKVEEEAEKTGNAPVPSAPPVARIQPQEDFPDLVAEADAGTLGPLIGRTRELEQVIQILSRKTKSSPILIGDPGVGKDSIVRGLAQRIAQDAVPRGLSGRQILVIDSSNLEEAPNFAQPGGPILYVRGLFDRRGAAPSWLATYLKKGNLQLITTAAPLSYRLALERTNNLARNFEVVTVLPPKEEEGVQIVTGVRTQYEKFHGVVLSPEAIQVAVSASGRFLRHLALPERAIDLIDEAGALVKLRREVTANDSSNTVTGDDIIDVIAARTSLTAAAVKTALEKTETPARMDEMRTELAAGIPVGKHDWVEGLSAYLADCSVDDTHRLVQAIRLAKDKFDRTA